MSPLILSALVREPVPHQLPVFGSIVNGSHGQSGPTVPLPALIVILVQKDVGDLPIKPRNAEGRNVKEEVTRNGLVVLNADITLGLVGTSVRGVSRQEQGLCHSVLVEKSHALIPEK